MMLFHANTCLAKVHGADKSYIRMNCNNQALDLKNICNQGNIVFYESAYSLIILFLNNWTEAKVITMPMLINKAILGSISSNGSTLQNIS